MRSFKFAGYTWSIEITIGTVRRIKAATGVDLLDPITKDENGVPASSISRALTDEWVSIEMIRAACDHEIAKHGMTDDQFFEQLDGATLAAAHGALLEAIADFFLARGQTHRAEEVRQIRITIQAAYEKARAAVEAAGEKARTGEPSSDAPGSSESTPTSGASGTS